MKALENLTLNNLKALGNDPEFCRLAASVIVAQTVSEATSERVKPIKRLVFDHFEFYEGELGQRLHARDHGRTGDNGRITDPENLFLCDDRETLTAFYAACDAAHKQAGYNLKPGFCPILVAQNLHRKAEYALLEYMDSKLGTEFKDCWGPNGEHKKKILDIMMSMALQNPLTEKLAKESLPRSQAACCEFLTDLGEEKAA